MGAGQTDLASVHHAICQTSSESVYFVALEGPKTPRFTVFSTASFCGGVNQRRRHEFERSTSTRSCRVSNCFDKRSSGDEG